MSPRRNNNRYHILRSLCPAAIIPRDGCLPYIQPHEFEGLLFSDVTVFSKVNPIWDTSVTDLRAIREAATTPEHINHGYETRPSRRITASCRGYNKVVHGSMLAAAIGIHTIAQECPSFNAWLDTLRRTT